MYIRFLRFFFGVYVYTIFEIFEKKTCIFEISARKSPENRVFRKKKSPGCICIRAGKSTSGTSETIGFNVLFFKNTSEIQKCRRSTSEIWKWVARTCNFTGQYQWDLKLQAQILFTYSKKTNPNQKILFFGARSAIFFFRASRIEKNEKVQAQYQWDLKLQAQYQKKYQSNQKNSKTTGAVPVRFESHCSPLVFHWYFFKPWSQNTFNVIKLIYFSLFIFFFNTLLEGLSHSTLIIYDTILP